MKNYKRIYINGASDSAGGGLYSETAKKFYKKHFNIEYTNEKDVTFGKFLADELGYEYVNEAICGSGSPRLVRTTFDFIREIGIEEAKKTIFILQIHDSIQRVEYYSAEINDYLVVNLGYKLNGNLEWIESTNDYANPNNSIEFYQNISKQLKDTIIKFHNPILYEKKIKMELIGLFSFFKLYNIPFFIESSDGFFQFGDSTFDKEFGNNIVDNIINIDGFTNIGSWATHHNKLLMHETNKYCNDNHPGLFAHKEYANKLKKIIENKLAN